VKLKGKRIYIIITIVVAAALAAGAIVYVFTKGGWEELSGGPRANIQGLVSGSISLMPEAGTKAIYGFYFYGNRVGSFSMEYVGERAFQGIASHKYLNNGSMVLTVGDKTVEMTIQGYEYYDMDGFPLHATYIYGYMRPEEMTMALEYTWNRAQSKMYIKTYVKTAVEEITVENVATVPAEYWEPIQDLYIGYSKQLTYAINGTSVTLMVNVTGEEDVTVPKGTYRCYVVGISQPELGMEMTSWIDTTNGAVSQMEFTMGGLDFTIMLERYGIEH
jgi:hypothetical protein